jgi:hypothetical protein
LRIVYILNYLDNLYLDFGQQLGFSCFIVNVVWCYSVQYLDNHCAIRHLSSC